jgi:protocatechuate 3,4-dioxygenase alpha subunit
MNDDRGITPAQTIGPFWHLLARPGAGVVAAAETVPRLRVEGTVLDGDGAPVTDALLELWQADPEGRYPTGAADGSRLPGFTGFARAATDGAGGYAFDAVRPGPVPGPGGRLQAPHLVLALFARGLLDRLYCRIYFAGEPGNDGDPILERVPPARRRTLIATAIGEARYRFDVHLQGATETVFFRC